VAASHGGCLWCGARAGRGRGKYSGMRGHSSRWWPWWKDSARGWRCSIRGPAPSAPAARPGTSAGKTPWPGRSSRRWPAAGSPARSAWLMACSPRGSPPGPPGKPGPRSWPRARHRRSWPRTRSASWATRSLPTCCPGWASGRWGSSRRCRPPRRRTGSEATERPRTGWRAAWIPARWPLARPRSTCPFPWRSTRRPSSPSRRCSPPRRSPSGCTPAWPTGGWPACGSRSRWFARTGRRSPGYGGTTACCPRWRWPSGCGGSWPAGGRRSPVTRGSGSAGSPCCG
jgi:hypothetical protein